MKMSSLNNKILIFAFPVIVLCLWTFLCSANAQLIPDQASEIAKIKAAIKAKGARWIAGETSVSRLPIEQARMLCGTILTAVNEPGPAGEEAAPYLESMPLPSSFDWRSKDGINYVTSVKNQMDCGSCWAFATVGGFESQILIENPALIVNLSEQYLVSCNTTNNGCCGGFIDRACIFLLNTGTTNTACIPYSSDGAYYYRGRRCIDSSDPCPSSCTDMDDLIMESISGWEWISNTVSSIKEALNENGPVPCGMAVYDDFRFYEGGIYEHSSGQYLGGHAVIIIGWEDSNQCWICKNSWGMDWGEGYTGGDSGGYFRIKYGDSYIGDSAVKLLYAPMITCSSDGDCDDENDCTTDSCVNPGTFDSYCENTSLPNDTFCVMGICCSGECITPICSTDEDCSDENSCTTDTCIDLGTCNATCSNTWPDCGPADGCCGPTCSFSSDPDCSSCLPGGEPCNNDSECCSGRCRGRPGEKTCRE